MDYQRAHPEKVSYTRSRFFTSSTEGSAEESWMFLDDYERREDFDRWMKAVREDPDLVRLAESFYPDWDALIVPGSRKGEAGPRSRASGPSPGSRSGASIGPPPVGPGGGRGDAFGYVVTMPGEVRETRPEVILTHGPIPMPEFGSACRVRFGPRVDGPVAMVRGWFAERGRESFVWLSA